MMAYSSGLMISELGAPQYDGGRAADLMIGALPLASPFSVLDPDDTRGMDTLDVLEESDPSAWELLDLFGIAYPTSESFSAKSVQELEAARQEVGDFPRTTPGSGWHPSISRSGPSTRASISLQDEIPGFLRCWINELVATVGANGKLWEHWHPDSFAPCDNPDNGTSGWFLGNFRNMLVDGDW